MVEFKDQSVPRHIDTGARIGRGLRKENSSEFTREEKEGVPESQPTCEEIKRHI